jgi:hypothetical protein
MLTGCQPYVGWFFRPRSWFYCFAAVDTFQPHLERRERHINAMLAEARQDQLMHLMAQRHAVPHLGGKNTQLENLDPLLQVDEKRLRRRGR